jgi:hypothetical protein
MTVVVDGRVARKEVHVGDEDETMIPRPVFPIAFTDSHKAPIAALAAGHPNARRQREVIKSACYDAIDLPISDMDICASSLCCCPRFHHFYPPILSVLLSPLTSSICSPLSISTLHLHSPSPTNTCTCHDVTLATRALIACACGALSR